MLGVVRKGCYGDGGGVVQLFTTLGVFVCLLLGDVGGVVLCILNSVGCRVEQAFVIGLEGLYDMGCNERGLDVYDELN